MRRVFGFILTSAVTADVGLWLLFELFVADRAFEKHHLAACFMLGVGLYWLWADYIATPSQEE